MENPYLKEKLTPIEVKEKTISQLLKEMSNTGFQGRKVGEVVDVWERMIRDKDVAIFMGFAGSMSTTGQWKIIKWLMENHFIDALVSTGANISEDIQDSMHGYYKGHWLVNDADLLKHNVFRYYDVFTDGLKYREMTELIRAFINSLKEDYPYSTREFCEEFGKYLSAKKIDCLLATAYKNKIPVYSPAIVDSEYGIAAVLSRRWDKKHVVLDQLKDFDELAKIGEKSKNTGVIYIGGGVPKDTVQLITAIVSILQGEKLEYPHKYAIQITTDSPQWGGLSGCTFEEAISWGKITKVDENKTVCYCDATIAMPLIAHALNERIKNKRQGKMLSDLFKI